MILKKLIDEFVAFVSTSGEVELYNEAGLRHELATFIEQRLNPEKYGIQLEREARAVVLADSEEDFQDALLDIYVFERAGKGQFCLQVMAPPNLTALAWAEAPKQVKFLKQLLLHGFQEGGLFLAFQQPFPTAETPADLNAMLPNLGNAIEWNELLPAWQDNNGPWKYFFLQPGKSRNI